MQPFNRVAVFSATKARDREELGDKISRFLETYRGEIVDKTVAQSSDREFHCLSIVLFLLDEPRKVRRTNGRLGTASGDEAA